MSTPNRYRNAVLLIGLAAAGCSPRPQAPGAVSADIPAESPPGTPAATFPIPSPEADLRSNLLRTLTPESRSLVEALGSDAFQKYSLPSRGWIARGVRGQVEAELEAAGKAGGAYDFLLEGEKSPADTTAEMIEGIRRAYDRRREEAEQQETLLVGTNELVSGTLRAGSIAAAASGTGVGGSLLLEAANQGMNRLLQKTLQEFEESARESAKKWLGRKLWELPPSAWKEWDRLPGLPPEQARERARELTSGWLLQFSRGAEGGDASSLETAAQGFVLQALAGQVAHEGSLRALAERHRNESLENLGGDLRKVSQVFLQFGVRTGEQLQAVVDSQKELRAGMQAMVAGLGDVTGKLDGLTSDVGFLKEFSFGRMTPAEQLAALHGGLFDGMSESQRQAVEKKIELVQKRQGLHERISRYLNGAQTLIDLGQQFGVDPVLLNRASQIVQISSGVAQVVDSVLSGGGPLAMAGAVGGLVGLGGPDVGETRHRQVMERLDILLDGQARMLQLQQDILKTQAAILEGQRVIIEQLEALSKQVTLVYEGLSRQLDAVRGDVLYNRDLVRQLLLREAGRCPNFLGTRGFYDSSFDPAHGLFSSFELLTAHFRDQSGAYHSCVQGLEDLFRRDGQGGAQALALRSYDAPGSGISAFLERMYDPALAYLKAKVGSAHPSHPGVLVAGFFAASESVRLAGTKFGEIRASEVGRFDRLRILRGSLAAFQSAQALERYADDLLAIHPYFELVEGGSIRDLEQLLGAPAAGAPRSLKARLLLDGALERVRLAIGQEALVAGDGLLGFLHQEPIPTGAGHDAECPDQAGDGRLSTLRCLLEANPLLARNFLAYSMREELRQSGNSLLAYHFALSMSGSPSLLRRVLVKPWEYRYQAPVPAAAASGTAAAASAPGWSVRIGSRWYPLPTAAELAEDRMSYRPEIGKLLALRERLASARADYEIEQFLAPSERQALGAAVRRGR